MENTVRPWSLQEWFEANVRQALRTMTPGPMMRRRLEHLVALAEREERTRTS